jgi:hypothetical protein
MAEASFLHNGSAEDQCGEARLAALSCGKPQDTSTLYFQLFTRTSLRAFEVKASRYETFPSVYIAKAAHFMRKSAHFARETTHSVRKRSVLENWRRVFGNL